MINMWIVIELQMYEESLSGKICETPEEALESYVNMQHNRFITCPTCITVRPIKLGTVLLSYFLDDEFSYYDIRVNDDGTYELGELINE